MKKNKKDYELTIPLNHNEGVAVVNIETGELGKTMVGKKRGRPRKSFQDKEEEVWLPGAVFQKHFPQSWRWLRLNTTDSEFKAAFALANMAKAYTNSLEPLNDATILTDLVLATGVNRNIIGYTMHKLWKLGVYAKFEVYDKSKPYTKYWILNPYLSFNGQVIKSDIASLFKGTYVAMAYRNIPFTLDLS